MITLFLYTHLWSEKLSLPVYTLRPGVDLGSLWVFSFPFDTSFAGLRESLTSTGFVPSVCHRGPTARVAIGLSGSSLPFPEHRSDVILSVQDNCVGPHICPPKSRSFRLYGRETICFIKMIDALRLVFRTHPPPVGFVITHLKGGGL